MSGAIFIGDEITAAGFRLAGIEAISPADDELAAAFDDAIARAEFVMLGASRAHALGDTRLEHALLRRTPLVGVVPDAAGALPDDLALLAKRTLGIAQ